MLNRKIIYSLCVLGSLVGGYAMAAPQGLVGPGSTPNPTAQRGAFTPPQQPSVQPRSAQLQDVELAPADFNAGWTDDRVGIQVSPNTAEAAAATNGTDFALDQESQRRFSTNFQTDPYGSYSFSRPQQELVGTNSGYGATAWYYNAPQPEVRQRSFDIYANSGESSRILYQPQLNYGQLNLTDPYVQGYDGTGYSYSGTWGGVSFEAPSVWQQSSFTRPYGLDPRTYTPMRYADDGVTQYYY